jgi:hypothetical protein
VRSVIVVSVRTFVGGASMMRPDADPHQRVLSQASGDECHRRRAGYLI